VTSLNEYPNPEERIVKDSPNILDLLDFCKGLAIICIILHHYNQLLSAGWQGVHIFIALSGFGLTYSCIKKNEEISWKSWYFKRLRKILPAYWLIVICGYFVVVWLEILKGSHFLSALWMSKRVLLFDLLLIKNFFRTQISTFPNVSLWFVPFILSFYLAFPILYKWITKHRKPKKLLFILLIMIAIEAIYRAIALYFLDGVPIAYDKTIELTLPFSGILHSQLPESIPFQGEAPFGFFPSRIAEFTLGILAAIAFFRSKQRTNQVILNFWTGLLGFLIWLVGNMLLNAGLWGWFFSDFLITLGLVLWSLNLALLCQEKTSLLFSKMNQVGKNSYYIFLTHALFIQAMIVCVTSFTQAGIGSVYNNPLVSASVLIGILGLTAISCKLLQKIEQAQSFDYLMQRIIGKLLFI
jgi:peptidoglycan/LPS O-acetylase OafA/YrhL